MKNPNVSFIEEGSVWYVKKGASISVCGITVPYWDHAQHTTRELYFDVQEVHEQDAINITFRREFNGSIWFLKINKIV